MSKVTPFLMYQGNAEEAIQYYVSLIEGSSITSITRYGAGQGGPEGCVMQAVFTLKGQEFMCIDSAVQHNFTFTPSFSIFVTCDTDEEINRIYGRLADDGGAPLMPLGDYGFSRKFGWIADQYGVSWQLNLPAE
jgi:predicted 3-demethylubiquinone-9 3-methyltransferase (glyoxalase superfamily)